MKLSLFKKVCLTVMGVGVVSSLVSVGTFATFTATTTNSANTFAAGTLKMTSVLNGGTSVGNLTSAPNRTGVNTNFNANAATCSNVVATACGSVIETTQLTSEGMEPGQFATGTITITNSGTLPAAYAVQFQKLVNSTGNTATSTASTDCPADVGATGNTNTTPNIAACAVLGKGVNLTIQDDCTSGGNCATTAIHQCIYGKTSAGPAVAAPAANNVAASGACDSITTAGNLVGTTSIAPGTSAATGGSVFGPTLAGDFATAVASATTTATSIYVNGSDTHTCSTCGAGNPTLLLPGEIHVITVNIAFPDTGTTASTLGGDAVTVGNETKYQGGSLGFDMVWLAVQQL